MASLDTIKEKLQGTIAKLDIAMKNYNEWLDKLETDHAPLTLEKQRKLLAEPYVIISEKAGVFFRTGQNFDELNQAVAELYKAGYAVACTKDEEQIIGTENVAELEERRHKIGNACGVFFGYAPSYKTLSQSQSIRQ